MSDRRLCWPTKLHNKVPQLCCVSNMGLAAIMEVKTLVKDYLCDSCSVTIITSHYMYLLFSSRAASLLIKTSVLFTWLISETIFSKNRWLYQQCQSSQGGRLVIQTGLSLTRLTSPCHNFTLLGLAFCIMLCHFCSTVWSVSHSLGKTVGNPARSH